MAKKNKKDWILTSRKSNVFIPLPKINQHSGFSCGAACLHVVFQYWGVALDHELDYWNSLETSKAYGTDPNKIVDFARGEGLFVRVYKDMSLDRLMGCIDENKPVIMPIQAHGNQKLYNQDKSGHYVVAIGYDDKNIYFEDPILRNFRGFLPKDELESRWHDCSGDGTLYNRCGIVIWARRKPSFLHQFRKIP